MSLRDDIDVFFDTEDFAVEAVYRESPSSSDRNITVVFTSEFAETQLGDVGYQNQRPTALCRTVDVKDASTESVLKIGARTFRDLAPQPDSEGMTLLELTED